MITTNSDGGARGNPGNGAIGVVIRKGDEIIEKYSEVLKGKVTNNIAEYWGLIRALQVAAEYTDGELTCILDSQLVIKQLLGKYRVKKPYLLKLFLKVQELQNKFEKINYQYTKRTNKYQKLADYLLNQELDKRFGPRR